jgi:hypothetical protein
MLFLGQTRSYPQPKSEKNKKNFTISYSLFYNELCSPISAIYYMLSAIFSTKRAASPLYRDVVFLRLACPELVEGVLFEI